MITKIQEIVEKMSGELPGILGAAVVSINDGLSIAESSREQKIETAAASAYLASIVKANSKAINLLDDTEVIEDMIITTSQSHFVVRHVPGQPFFVFLMTGKGEWLGKARMAIRKYEKDLARYEEFLREQFSE